MSAKVAGWSSSGVSGTGDTSPGTTGKPRVTKRQQTHDQAAAVADNTQSLPILTTSPYPLAVADVLLKGLGERAQVATTLPHNDAEPVDPVCSFQPSRVAATAEVKQSALVRGRTP